MKGKIIGGLLTIIVSILLFFAGLDIKEEGTPRLLYQVYLNGEKIGVIESKDKLYELIDNEETEIKEKYNVDKVYPPNGLDVKKIYSYDSEIVDIDSIYSHIKEKEPFTIEAYNVTIKYNSDKMADEDPEDAELKREDTNIYLMDKELIKKGLYNTAAAFLSEEALYNYEKDLQTEIEDTGEIITSVLFDETISIKKDLVSSEEYIFNDEDELSKYLLFGTLEEQEKYEVKEGENLSIIADNHQLNVEELLIANPQYPDADYLLAAGDILNVGLIDPVVSVVYKKTIVEDIPVAFKDEYIRDTTKNATYKVIQQEGKDGVSRITQDVIYVNGEVKSLDITAQEEIVPVINRVYVTGTQNSTSLNYDPTTSSKWEWPTTIPFRIVSRFSWRWGRKHEGIDIAGCGYGSPIYAVGDGIVYKTNYVSSKAEGISVRIDHGDGYTTIYMHLSKIAVKQGQTVKKHDIIGYMGCTGRCYGTHLHLGVFKGRAYEGGESVDPCSTLFSC